MNRKIASALLAVGLVAGGCQTSGKAGYIEIVQGDYRTLASCFARQPIGEDADGGTEAAFQELPTRRVTVNDVAARTLSVEVGRYKGTGYEANYEVTFTALTMDTTEVRGQAIGYVPFFWPERVLPAVARCSGRIRS